MPDGGRCADCKRFVPWNFGRIPADRTYGQRATPRGGYRPDDRVQVSAATVKRLEKQSVKSSGGVEIKIPADLYQDRNAVEFINNPDGTISLLIKNILL